jgi:hypothetical protein
VGPARSLTFRTLLLAGLILRCAALPIRGTVDMDVWKLWTYAGSINVTTMYGVGGNPPERAMLAWEHRRGTVEYPPATLYALAVVGHVYRAIDPSYKDGVGLNVAVKLSILLGDIALCLALWQLMRRSSEAAARTAVLFYWLNPAAILDGAVLGYLDPWLGALTMVAVLALDRGAFAWCGAALALTALTKLQILLILPAIGLALLQRAGRDWWKATLVATLAAGATAAVVLAPFIRIGALPNVIQGAGRAFHHDMLSAEATNLWWIVTWLLRASYAVNDLGAWDAWTMRLRILGISRVMELGYPNARVIGTVLGSSLMAWGFWRVRRAPLPIVLAGGAFAVHAYTMLSVQVHENHFYLALPLIAAAGAVLPRLRGPYVLASTVCFLNLFLMQGIGRDFPLPPRNITLVDATVLVSFLNIGALIWHARRFAEVSAHTPRVQPPSTGSVTPVTNDAAGDARNATAAANSSGVPIRPRGILSTILCSAWAGVMPSRAAVALDSSTTRSVRV